MFMELLGRKKQQDSQEWKSPPPFSLGLSGLANSVCTVIAPALADDPRASGNFRLARCICLVPVTYKVSGQSRESLLLEGMSSTSGQSALARLPEGHYFPRATRCCRRAM